MTLHLSIDTPGSELSVSREFMFAGDEVRLAGQMDYPVTSQTPSGFPLLFVLHYAGSTTRDDYQGLAAVALECSYAVFRWDKRGTGRSGGSARGSAVQDAVNAYAVALEQPGINRRRVVVAAYGAGTSLLGSAFGLFARLQHPHAALLIANKLDSDAILALDCPVQIVAGDAELTPWKPYAEEASLSHRRTYAHGAAFALASGADHLLRLPNGELHSGARDVIRAWLERLAR
jgi:alpha/beta superfamily hydrolase